MGEDERDGQGAESTVEPPAQARAGSRDAARDGTRGVGTAGASRGGVPDRPGGGAGDARRGGIGDEIVFASGNAGKLRELEALLAPLGYRVRAQGELGIESVEETATTFVENALLKARHAARASGRAALADDSGLEVDHLGGAPGLYSARHAERHGRGSGDEANNALLLEQLAGVPRERRSARFRSVVVLLRHAEDPSPILAEGVWEGHVLERPEPGGGFGYDPVFCNHDTLEAASRLAPEVKNRLSHRGKAVAALLAALERLSATSSRRASDSSSAS